MSVNDVELLKKKSMTKKSYLDSVRRDRENIKWNTGTRVHTSNKDYNRQRDKREAERMAEENGTKQD